MKSNLARRIDDTDDPRLPHPMFPRSDGQPESRKIFYIRLFRKRTPDGPIEFCPVRFLASESRDEGWTYFVERFGGGYYRAEATSSANKKQAYTGGSSLRWFHFPGKSKPFPLPGSAVQEPAKPSAPTMPSATWNEVRALLRSERRAFADLIEAERKASDERMIAVLERFEKMTREERERMQATDAMLREERERSKEAEERLIDALHWFEKTARNREDATRDALLRVTEVMRIHAGNEAVRISYDEWRPVDVPKPRKPRVRKPKAVKPPSRGVGRPKKSPQEDTGGQADRVYKERDALMEKPKGSPIGRAVHWIADRGSEFMAGKELYDGLVLGEWFSDESSAGAGEANASEANVGEAAEGATHANEEAATPNAEANAGEAQASEETATPNAEANTSASEDAVETNAASMSDVQETLNTSPKTDSGIPGWSNAPAWIHKYLKHSEKPTERESERPMDAAAHVQATQEEPSQDTPANHQAQHAPMQECERLREYAEQATDQAEAEHPHAPQTEAPTSAREGVSEGNDHPSQESAETPSSDASTACGEAEGSASPFIVALLNAQKRIETPTSEQTLNSEQTTRDNVVNGSPSMLEAASIRVQQLPPLHDPEGMTTIRTLHGWVTIPSEWLKPDASPAQLASLSRLLSEQPSARLLDSIAARNSA